MPSMFPPRANIYCNIHFLLSYSLKPEKQGRSQLEVTIIVQVKGGGGPGCGNISCFFFFFFCTKLLRLRRDVASFYRLDHRSADYCFPAFVNQV